MGAAAFPNKQHTANITNAGYIHLVPVEHGQVN